MLTINKEPRDFGIAYVLYNEAGDCVGNIRLTGNQEREGGAELRYTDKADKRKLTYLVGSTKASIFRHLKDIERIIEKA